MAAGEGGSAMGRTAGGADTGTPTGAAAIVAATGAGDVLAPAGPAPAAENASDGTGLGRANLGPTGISTVRSGTSWRSGSSSDMRIAAMPRPMTLQNQIPPCGPPR